MEACGAAHHWARVLGGLGHEVKLIASEATKPFVKRGKKNDAADAAAICAAASRPDARFVAVKSLEQQGVLALHSARTLLVKQRTMLTNAMRSLATEFGLVVPKGMDKLEELVALVEEDETFPEQARGVFTGLLERAVLLDQPLTRTAELQAGAVHQQVHGLGARARPRHLQRRRPAAEGGMIGHPQRQAEQADDGTDQPLGLPVGEAEHGAQRSEEHTSEL